MTSPKPKLHPTEIAATLHDVTVTYDGYQTRALSRVEVEIRRGQVTGVLGADGAGKSTLLKVLAGRLRATEGSVKVFGRSPQGGVKSRVGFLPGKPDANRPAGFMGRILGKKAESPGPRGVAGLAQAVLGNRDLLVLDDLFVGLNAIEMAEAKTMMRDLVARGKTIVLGSSALMEVADVCERLIILHEGRLQAVGTLPELLAGAGAIRFLPAVLPNEMVERVLTVLREEILSSSKSMPVAEQTSAGGKGVTVLKNEKSEAAPRTETEKSTPDDSIDHEKLEGLTKPQGNVSKK